jgi:hypothetical protein
MLRQHFCRSTNKANSVEGGFAALYERLLHPDGRCCRWIAVPAPSCCCCCNWRQARATAQLKAPTTMHYGVLHMLEQFMHCMLKCLEGNRRVGLLGFGSLVVCHNHMTPQDPRTYRRFCPCCVIAKCHLIIRQYQCWQQVLPVRSNRYHRCTAGEGYKCSTPSAAVKHSQKSVWLKYLLPAGCVGHCLSLVKWVLVVYQWHAYIHPLHRGRGLKQGS